jgi:hypothetical protein
MAAKLAEAVRALETIKQMQYPISGNHAPRVAGAALAWISAGVDQPDGAPTDTQRLNFLDSQRHWGDCFVVQPLDSGDVYVRPWRMENQSGRFKMDIVGPTIRDVIDTAMRAADQQSLTPADLERRAPLMASVVADAARAADQQSSAPE